MAQPSYVLETKTLRELARSPKCRFIWTKHALREVFADGRVEADVEYALTNCQVVLQEQKKDVLWRAVGRDLDGKRVQIVVAVFEEAITIKVVTTF